jgi:hypothetical protein
MAASYRLCADHYVGGAFLQAGITVTEGKEIPIGWPPTTACDPLNSEAIQNLWNVGPGAMIGANAPDAQGIWGIQSGRWVGVNVPPPVVRWKPAGPNNQFVLTGAGASFGIKQAF